MAFLLVYIYYDSLYLNPHLLCRVIINLLMQLKLLLILLLAVTLSANVLKHFERDIAAIKIHYSAGETSKVYSIFMKMLLQTKTLYEELEILHPHVPKTTATNCSAMMEELVGLLVSPHWA